jgi:acyl-CoA synthetase (AMP-forming)/AMP-acid ligase II
MLTTMAAVIARNAALNARRPAVTSEGRSYTHAQHAARIWALADAIKRAASLQQQDRIAILSQNRSEYLEVYGAAEAGGLITATVNWRLAPPEIARVIDDCTPAVLFIEDRLLELYAKARPLLTVPQPRLVVIGNAHDDAIPYEELIAGGDTSPPPATPDPDEIAHIIYTSGTTGRPKGATWSQRALAYSAATICTMAGERPTDRILLPMPLFHSGAKIEWSAVQFLGGSCVILREFEPGQVVAQIAQEGVTMAHLAPVMVKRLVDHLQQSPMRFPLLRRIHYGSAPVAPEDLRRATAVFGPIFAQLYGMTEHVISSMLLPYQARLDGTMLQERRLSSAGQPYPGTSVRILDDEGGDRPLGEIGEIVVRSSGMMSGYWRNPGMTAEVLREGWLHTGDMGLLDEDGFLYIIDRKKDMIVSGGENIYSREVEDALVAHPMVAEAAVIGVPDPRWGEGVMAYVVLREGMQIGEAALIDHCRTLIAGYKRPQKIAFVVALPRLPHGKIDKKALRAPHWDAHGRQVS